MANYQHYQRFRPRGERSAFNWTRILIIGGIIFVVFLIGRSIFSNQPAPTLTLPNDNAVLSSTNADTNTNTTNQNSNTNGNTNAPANINSDANVNVNIAASTSGFSLETCTKVMSRGSADQKQVALTFNVGTAKEGEIQAVLDGLKTAQVTAEFFARGDVAELNSSMIKKISDDGFPVYNLSYSHPRFNDLPASGIAEQLSKADQAIGQATGQSTKPFFRPPYGEADADVVAAVKQAGYCPITWTVDALDWSSDYTAAQSKDRVLNNAVPGAIILMQASNSVTAEIVPDLVAQLKSQGYGIVSLETLLK
ncbi:MAG: polysaccharide deacetylase family protein [Patescibacteria group bacterium]